MEQKNKLTYRIDRAIMQKEWPLLLLMAGLLLTAVLVYPHLPDQVPSHWNMQGEVDDYQGRFFGAFFAPLLTVGLYLLLLFLPLIDPKRDNYLKFKGAYTFLRWGLVVFMAVVYGLTILAALGYAINIGLAVKAMVSFLLIVIGNFMGQFRHNYFVGIKTPWTLANEEVWQRTHRLGGKLWVIGGLFCLAVSPFDAGWAAVIFFGAIMVMTIVPILYSYLLFAKLKEH
ncbi:MAG: SdpI family protein [Syntrophomonadaceae bacterium]|nr:SdpI family protein [Syntrophomonadaceae bacterium]